MAKIKIWPHHELCPMGAEIVTVAVRRVNIVDKNKPLSYSLEPNIVIGIKSISELLVELSTLPPP